MKICIITPIYYPYAHGGLESYVLELVQELLSRGHQVSVITRGPANATLPDDGHGEIHQIRHAAFRSFLEVNRRPKEWLLKHLEEMFSGHCARVTRRLVGRIQPEVLFSQQFYGFGRNMPQTLARLRIPWLHYVHSYGLLCKRQTAVDSHGRSCPAQCSGCKWISLFKHGPAPLRDAITIYNSDHMRRFCEAAGEVVREAHIVDPVLRYAAPRISAHYDPAPPVRLAYVGRLSPEKGIQLLCKAVAAQPARYRLEVLGDGPLLAELRARHGADPALSFHGRVEPERRDALLTQAHALVAPSLWNEPFGRVVNEGFLAGLPVITAAVGAMGARVRHGVDGIVFQWRAGAERQSLDAALEEAAPLLARLRQGALDTRERLLRQDNFTLIEDLLIRAAAPAGAGLQPTGGPRR